MSLPMAPLGTLPGPPMSLGPSTEFRLCTPGNVPGYLASFRTKAMVLPRTAIRITLLLINNVGMMLIRLMITAKMYNPS